MEKLDHYNKTRYKDFHMGPNHHTHFGLSIYHLPFVFQNHVRIICLECSNMPYKH